MSNSAIDWSKLRPHAELEPRTQQALELAAAEGGVPGEVLRHRTGLSRRELEDIRVQLHLLDDLQDQWKTTLLGLLYVPAAAEDLARLDRLVRLLHERYEPGALIDSAAILEAIGFAHLEPEQRGKQLDRFERWTAELGVMSRRSLEEDAVVADGLFPSMRRYLIREPARTIRDLQSALIERFRWAYEKKAPELRARPLPFRMRVTALEVRRFRALKRLDLSLAPLTVLVGPNGSGKSTVLDVLGFVASALRSGIETAIGQGGLSRLRTFGPPEPLRISVSFDLAYEGDRVPGSYAFTLEEIGGTPIVRKEELRIAGEHHLDAAQGRARVRLPSGAMSEHFPAAGQLALPQLSDVAPVLADVRTALAGVQLIDRDPGMHGPAFGGARRRAAAVDGIDLLQPVLDSPERASHLSWLVNSLIPAIEKVTVEHEGATGRRLAIHERGLSQPLQIDELSAGMRQVLLLCAALVNPEKPAALLVEEPEGGLHPGALPALRDLLRSIGGQTTVIVTTHSPQLIGLLDARSEVLALDRTDAGVAVHPLEDALRSGRWLQVFGAPAEAFVHAASERGG